MVRSVRAVSAGVACPSKAFVQQGGLRGCAAGRLGG
jgi:hypothetical protein